MKLEFKKNGENKVNELVYWRDDVLHRYTGPAAKKVMKAFYDALTD